MKSEWISNVYNYLILFYRYAVEAFRRFDTGGSGFISALDFSNIMTQIKTHLLTKEVKDNLMSITHTQKVGD